MKSIKFQGKSPAQVAIHVQVAQSRTDGKTVTFSTRGKKVRKRLLVVETLLPWQNLLVRERKGKERNFI